MPVEKILRESKISDLEPSRPVFIGPGAKVADALGRMKEEKTGCLIIMGDGGKTLGILTERDVLNRIAGDVGATEMPVERFMTASPTTLTMESALGEAIRLMEQGGYRHVPIVGGSGQIDAIISIRNVVKFLAELFPTEVLNLPPHPHVYIATREGG